MFDQVENRFVYTDPRWPMRRNTPLIPRAAAHSLENGHGIEAVAKARFNWHGYMAIPTKSSQAQEIKR